MNETQKSAMENNPLETWYLTDTSLVDQETVLSLRKPSESFVGLQFHTNHGLTTKLCDMEKDASCITGSHCDAVNIGWLGDKLFLDGMIVLPMTVIKSPGWNDGLSLSTDLQLPCWADEIDDFLMGLST